MRYRRALVALDGSDNSGRTLDWLRCVEPDTELTLLRVFEPVLAMTDPGMLQPMAPFEDAGEEYLAHVAAGIAPTPRLVVRIGTPWVHILREARRESRDLIVVATRGGARLRRRILGGTIERLLDHSEIPLMVVPARMGALPVPDRVRRLAIPVDESPSAQATLLWAISLARRLESRIDLIDVCRSASGPDPEEMGEEPNLAAVVAESHAPHRLHLLARSVERSGVPVDVVDARGPFPALFLHVAGQRKVDLIALAIRRQGAVERLFFGSKASRLIQESHVPVLVARHDLP